MRKSIRGAAALVLLSAGLMAAQNLRIVRAEYGHDTRWTDVTDLVRRASRGGRLDIVVSNQTFGGDPAPAELKALRIEYTLNGRPMQENIPENTRLVLPRGYEGRQDFRDGLTIVSAQYGSNRRRVDVSRQVSAFLKNSAPERFCATNRKSLNGCGTTLVSSRRGCTASGSTRA